MIKVATQGGKTKEVKYQEDMNVRSALEAAEIKPSRKATVTVNGKDAKMGTRLQDGSTVVVTPKISNG